LKKGPCFHGPFSFIEFLFSMKKLLLFLLIPLGSFSQITMSSASGSHYQNFNTLSNSTVATNFLDNITIPGWYSQRTTSSIAYSAGTGSSLVGGLYSYGTAGSTERALGTIGSNNTSYGGNFAHGVQFFNNTGAAVTQMAVSYKMEQWRCGGNTTPNALTFWYKILGTQMTDLNPGVSTGWTQVTALTTTSPVNSATAGALDGNLPANKVILSNVSITGINIPNGSYIMLKWDDPDHTGSDHGLSIDDVTITWGCASSAILTQSSCGTYNSPAGNSYSTSGVYNETAVNATACDSVITIDLSVTPSTTYYVDADLDGFGDDATAVELCADPGVGYSTIGGDCNDSDDMVYPGAMDLCDGVDNDCDLSIDEDATFMNYYVDADLDGYGTGGALLFCSNPGPGFSTNNSDCDDNDNNAIFPMMYYPDGDSDGFGDQAANGTVFCNNPGAGWANNNNDCNDAVNTIYPGAPEICDGLDNNCVNGIDEGLSFTDYYVDADGDLHGAGPSISFCSNPGAGYSLLSDDCNDANPAVYPGATEILNNGTDENCDGTDNYLGLNENSGSVVAIYPNPTKGDLNIERGTTDEKAIVQIIDIKGRIVVHADLIAEITKLDLSRLENGSYIVRISSEKGVSIHRLTISK
jgi:hypothetical protein